MRFLGFNRLTKTIFVVSLVAFNFTFPMSAQVSAACAPPTSTDFGKVTFASVSVTEAATYRIWTRMQTPANGTGYTMRIDDNTCINIAGGAAISSWTWVDYKDGSVSTKAQVSLSAGSHKIELIGTSEGVLVDRVILTKIETNGTTCVPNQTVSNASNPDVTTHTIGDNCTTDTTPRKPGDANSDGAVDTKDAVILSLNWGKPGKSFNEGNFNETGNVDTQDAVILSLNWNK